ncbi:MAG TPA: hypothetical protein VF762_13485, partial [Blastocatellia bacterium]
IEPPKSLSIPRGWEDTAALAGFFSAPFLLYGIYCWLNRKSDPDKPPKWDQEGPRHLPLSKLGGAPSPHLDDATLDQIADSLGYFKSEMVSKVLDVRASIEAAARNAGLPSPVFRKRKQLRTVYVLEDSFAEALAWNHTPQELAEGLSIRGINVVYAKFYGTPRSFHTDDVRPHWLEDLEDNRRDCLILLFSDGNGVRYRRDYFTLEMLSRWPMVAWMELREPRSWDESTAVIARFNIPIYPATGPGLLQAMDRFLTERGQEQNCSHSFANRRGVPPNVGDDLYRYVEQLLGDALTWAQACAMIQPITPGLADGLRVRFQPHLPPWRIERLFMLPGTTRTTSGLRFSIPVLSVLRSGFAIRWDKESQETILGYILQKVKEIEPREKDSLAHLTWEVTLERVRLELDPDRAAKRLAELEKTPLSAAIKAELDPVVLPDARKESNLTSPSQIPLRVKPQSQMGLERLARIAKQVSLDEDKSPKPTEPVPFLFKVIRYAFRGITRDLGKGIKGAIKSKGELSPKYLTETYSLIKRKLGSTVSEAIKLAQETPPGIMIFPPKLVFANLKRNRRRTRPVTIQVSGGSSLTGVFSSDVDWVVIRPAIIDSKWIARTVWVTVDTSNLDVGAHSAKLIFYGLDENKEAPIDVTVVDSAFRGAGIWWKENKPSVLIRAALCALALALSVLVVRQLLPANWVNGLYNHPPKLESLDLLAPDGHQGEILLKASVKDQDNDQVMYEWQADRGEIKSQVDFIIALDLTGIAPDQNLTPVEVRLRLKDNRGGESYYGAKINLGLKPIPSTGSVNPVDDAGAASGRALGPGEFDQYDLSQGKNKAEVTLSANAPGVTVDIFKQGNPNPIEFKGWVNIPGLSKTIKMSPGSYTFVFMKDAFIHDVKDLEVLSGSYNVSGVIKPDAARPGSTVPVSFKVNVDNVLLDIDGVQVNASTDKVATLNLAPGIHKLVATKDGYERVEVPVIIKDNLPYSYDITLGPPSLEDYRTQAQVAYQSGLYSKALSLINMLLEAEPDDAEVKALKQQILYASKALERTPEAPVALFRMRATLPGVKTKPAPVNVEVTIDEQGNVIDAKAPGRSNLPSTSQNPAQTALIYDAAEDAARKWKFVPTKVAGLPVKKKTVIKISFE